MNDVQVKVRKQPQRGCSKGKLSVCQNGKDAYRREAATGMKGGEYGTKDVIAKHKVTCSKVYAMLVAVH